MVDFVLGAQISAAAADILYGTSSNATATAATNAKVQGAVASIADAVLNTASSNASTTTTITSEDSGEIET